MSMATAALGLLLAWGAPTSAQITKSDLGTSGILGSSILDRLENAIAGKLDIGDKDHPLVVELPEGFGTIYEFKRGDTYILLVVGTKAIDLTGGVVMPTNQFVLSSYVAVIAKSDVSLALADLPSSVREAVGKLWPSGSMRLRSRALLLRAEPSGDVLTFLKGFLSLNDFSGTTVMEFQKGATAVTTGLIAYGKVAKPFGMDLDLTDPQFFFTSKGSGGPPKIGLASDIEVYDHKYSLMAEASDPKRPDIFVLRTPSMSVGDIANLMKAMSKPLFDIAPASVNWNMTLGPTVSLAPVTNAPRSGFGIVDTKNVVIYVARSKPASSEWNIEKVPGLTIRGDLLIDVLKQRVAAVSIEADRSGFQETIGLGAKVPGSSASFGAVSETIRISTGTSYVRIDAESPEDCFKQKLSFLVDSKGKLVPSMNVGETAGNLAPTAFYGNLKGCANLGVKTATWALQTGVQLLGYAGDKALDAAALAVGSKGANAIGIAARDLKYAATDVSKSLGQVMNKDDLLNLGEKLYPDKLVSFAAGAGYGAVDIMHWTHAFPHDADAIGKMFKDSGVDKDTFLNAANTVWPKETIGKIARGAGYGATDLYHWAWAFHIPLKDVGIMNAQAFFKDDVLGGAQTVWGSAGQLSNEGIAELGKSVGYSATEVKDWFAVKAHLGDREIVRVLRAGGYAKDQVQAMAKDAWNWSSSTFNDTWSAARDKVFGWIP
ncbi:MAG: hypothetical protein P3B98_06595 [Gemmatimonadota bacterium]|nr:hypothetical protein [Gemmatimonadota bacterium]